MKKFFPFVVCLSLVFSLPAQAQAVYNSVSEMLSAVQNPIVLRRAATLKTLGINSLSDGLPPLDWAWDSTNTLPTNAVRLQVGTNTVGRLVHNWQGDVRVFGWSKTGTAAQNGAAFRAAVAYSDSLTDGKREIHIPSGTYDADYLGEVVSTSIRGENWVDVGFDGAPTIIQQELGNTNDLLTITSTNTSKPTIENLWLYAAGESGRRNEKSIVSVASRISFTVATGDLPTVPPDPATFPYYGYCFFYSSEGRYMGCGVVEFINAGTGEVTLQVNSDTYATTTAGTGLLTSSEKVIFSPVVTEAPIYTGAPITATGPDPTRVAPVGIRINSKGYTTLRNLRVMYGHCGVVAGTANTGLQMENVNLEWSKFAGFANTFPGKNSDAWNGQVRVGGFYIKEPDAAAEVTTFNDSSLRNTYAALYMPSYSSSFDDLLVYSTLYGIVGSVSYHVMVGVMMLDDIVLDGIMWKDGNVGTLGRGIAFQVGNGIIRPVFQFKRPVYYTNHTAAIRFNGNQAVKGRFGMLAVERVDTPSATNLFDFVYDGTSQSEQGLGVGVWGTVGGAVQLYNPNKGRLLSSHTILTSSNTFASFNERKLVVRQPTNSAAGYSANILDIHEETVGTGGKRYDAYVLGNVLRYSHATDGSIDNISTNNGSTRTHRWRTDGTNTSEVLLGWGSATDSTLNIRGDQLFARTTSSTNTVAAPLYLQAPGGNVVVGNGTTSRLTVNGSDVVTRTNAYSAPVISFNDTSTASGTIINNIGSTGPMFRVQGNGLTALQLSYDDWSTVGETPWSIRYNGATPQIGVTNINGAAVLYLIGTTPP
jgi:hypothetical protein